MLPDAQVLVELVLLRAHPDEALDLLHVVLDVEPADGGGAVARRHQTRED